MGDIMKTYTPITRIFIDELPVVIKREDLNETGSQKDRGVPVQIDHHIKDGKTRFVISSSGNSAISAINRLINTEYHLTVFLSKNISTSKLLRISLILKKNITQEDTTIQNIELKFTERPVSDAFKYANSSESVLLRGSIDPYATIGYQAITHELAEQSPGSTDIFIPTSSGTTLVGIFNGYEDLKDKDPNILIPRFHVCQTTAVNTIARDFDTSFQPTKNSIAESIVDRVAKRYHQVSDIIKSTTGSGWVLTDAEIRKAVQLQKDLGLELSNESALALAGMLRAVRSSKYNMDQPIVLSTGVK